VFVRVSNQHPIKKKLYVHIFDIGVAQKIDRLTASWPAGYELEFNEVFTLGQTASGVVRGRKLGWSDQLPPTSVRPEMLIVIITEECVDLASLETRGATSDWAMGSKRTGFSPLQELMRQVLRGATRDLGFNQPPEGYLVHHINFDLDPVVRQTPAVKA